jgi:twinkle protein
MEDSITRLYHSQEPIDEAGRFYLVDRCLSIPAAIKAGVCSADGFVYFLYFENSEVVRWKRRSLVEKKMQNFNILPLGVSKDFTMPFFCQFKDPSSDYLIITEGEFDCIALRSLGACNVASLPSGASSVSSCFKANYHFLQQFSEIYIAFDMDKAGEDAVKVAMTMISPSKFRRIVFPNKDANEWLIKNPDLEFSDLENLMRNAKRIDDDCGKDAATFPEKYYKAIDIGISSGFRPLDKVIGGIRKGELTVVSADTGSGKSTFSLNLMKNLADLGKKIWINSYEMSPIIVNRKLASLVLRKPLKYQEFMEEDKTKYVSWLEKHQVLINCSTKKIDVNILRDQFEKFVLGYGVEYVLLDHLDYIHGNGKQKSTLENIDEAMREIHVLAMEFNVGIILVVHPKQLQRGEQVTISDFKGSASIKQYADNIIILQRMDREDPNDARRVKIKVCKNRLVGIECQFSLNYVSIFDGYEERYVV